MKVNITGCVCSLCFLCDLVYCLCPQSSEESDSDGDLFGTSEKKKPKEESETESSGESEEEEEKPKVVSKSLVFFFN